MRSTLSSLYPIYRVCSMPLSPLSSLYPLPFRSAPLSHSLHSPRFHPLSSHVTRSPPSLHPRWPPCPIFSPRTSLVLSLSDLLTPFARPPSPGRILSSYHSAIAFTRPTIPSNSLAEFIASYPRFLSLRLSHYPIILSCYPSFHPPVRLLMHLLAQSRPSLPFVLPRYQTTPKLTHLPPSLNRALFVQPRYAKMLSSQRLHARLGRPLPDPSEPAVEGSLAPSPALAPAPPKAE